MSKNIDEERVIEFISIINKNIKLIENKNIQSKDELEQDIDKYYVCSMAMFTILNYIIELGEEIIEKEKLDFPKKYSDVFKIIMQGKLIEFEEYKKLQQFIKTRNEIAHEYGEMLEAEIYWAIKNIDTINQFLKLAKIKLLK